MFGFIVAALLAEFALYLTHYPFLWLLSHYPPSAAAAGALVGKKARPLPTSRAAGTREESGSGPGEYREQHKEEEGAGVEGGSKLVDATPDFLRGLFGGTSLLLGRLLRAK